MSFLRRFRRVRSMLRRAVDLELSTHALQRLHWFTFALEHQGNVSLTCRHFGIARSTFLRWAGRFNPRDPLTLEERPRIPHHVRQPETDKKIIERIRVLRTEQPLISKESIASLLTSEGIRISASTVGRVIARHHFFFADTPLHRRKRAELNDGEEQALHLLIMRFSPTRIGLALLILLAMISGPGIAHASQSPSYLEQGSIPDRIGGSMRQSPSFEVHDEALTWTQMPLFGSTMQIMPMGMTAMPGVEQGTLPPSPENRPSSGGGSRRKGAPAPQPSRPSAPPPPTSRFTPGPALKPRTAAPVPTRKPGTPGMPGLRQPSRVPSQQPKNGFMTPARPATLAPSPRPKAVPGRPFVLPTTKPSTRVQNRTPVPAARVSTPMQRVEAPTQREIARGNRRATTPLRPRRTAFSASLLAAVGSAGMRAIAFILMLLTIGVLMSRRQKKNVQKSMRRVVRRAHRMRKTSTHRRSIVASLLLFGIILFGLDVIQVLAASAGPQTHMYTGRLLNRDGHPMPQQHMIRFSYWKSPDAVAGDVLPNGDINPAAPQFGGWQEMQMITPAFDGSFAAEMGSTNPLPSLASFSPAALAGMFLQVEVKPVAALNTAYELLDPKPDDPAFDRSRLVSIPFAMNADMLDQHDIGTGSGSIPLLGSGGLLETKHIPGGTFADTFTINADNSPTGNVTLKFGETLAKTLSFDVVNNRFNFNANVRIQGDLLVTGLINGVDITTLQSGEESVRQAFHAEFTDATYQGDGSDNVGQLFTTHDNVNLRNYYQWSTTRSTLQDYDVILRAALPSDFIRWKTDGGANPISFTYRSTSSDSANSKLDVQVYDTNGSPVTLSGSTANLANTSWTTGQIEFSGTPTWTAGQEFIIRLKLSAKNTFQTHLGSLVLQYIQ